MGNLGSAHDILSAHLPRPNGHPALRNRGNRSKPRNLSGVLTAAVLVYEINNLTEIIKHQLDYGGRFFYIFMKTAVRFPRRIHGLVGKMP